MIHTINLLNMINSNFMFERIHIIYIYIYISVTSDLVQICDFECTILK